MHVEPYVIISTQHAVPGVETDAHPDHPIGWPFAFSKATLQVNSGRHGIAGAVEGGKDSVTLSTNHHTIVSVDRRPRDRIVLLKKRWPPVPQLLDEPSRAFDIRKHERDGSSGKGRCHTPIMVACPPRRRISREGFWQPSVESVLAELEAQDRLGEVEGWEAWVKPFPTSERHFPEDG